MAPSRTDLEGVLNGKGRVMQVYNQSSDPDGAPSLGLGGLCMGLSYSFIRGQLKASRDLVKQGNYFSFKKATAHARFAQASTMIARKLSSGEDRLNPLAKHDGFTVRKCWQVKWDQQIYSQVEIGKEITLGMQVEMLGRQDWLYAILSIYKATKASHAIAFKVKCPSGPYYFYDPNLGLFHFNDDNQCDDGFSALFARYYRSYCGCLMREISG